MTSCDGIQKKHLEKRGKGLANKPLLTQGHFYALMSELNTIQNKLESLTDKVIDEVNNGNNPKDLPLNEFFSTFCTLKAWDESHSTAKGYESSLSQFFKFLNKKCQNVRSLRQLTLMMVSEYIKYLKDKRIFSKNSDCWETLSEKTINEHIKKLRDSLEIVDSRGTQELRERLITTKRLKTKKKRYKPTDQELARIPRMLKILRESESEDHKCFAFIAATVTQFCGRTNALSELRFDMIEGPEDGEKPIVSYIGKHGVEQVKGVTSEWYRSFPKEWKKYVQEK